jgi:diguanylate cyclase (GGDEF)-like protein
MNHEPCRILIVDDQESMHDDYRKSLEPERAGACEVDSLATELFADVAPRPARMPRFQIDSAYQGAEAVDIVRQALERGEHYAVAFIDIRMPPGWNGIETTQHLWQLAPDVFVVLCSAYSDHSYEEIIHQLGHSDRFLILKKPFDPIEVRQLAMALTRRWSLERTDVLTGALNRRTLEEFLIREWATAARNDLPLSCAMLDLDLFKHVNDVYGHQAGDQVLRAVVNCIKLKCRLTDSVFRYGGEEICILMPNADECGAKTWAERTRAAIEELAIDVGHEVLHVTASVGVCERTDAWATPVELIAGADQALRQAKRAGRNCVRSASVLHRPGFSARQSVDLDVFADSLVRDAMRPVSITVAAVATVADVVANLIGAGDKTLPVVDASGHFVGTVSEWDVLGIPWTSDAWRATVVSVMQRRCTCFLEATPLPEVLTYLRRVPMADLPVLRGGVPVGMIGPASILRWYAAQASVPLEPAGSA